MSSRKVGRAVEPAEGREVGRAEGREVGRAEGREVGRAEGREVGRAEGREVGRAEGREVGRAEGREAGWAEAPESPRTDPVVSVIVPCLDEAEQLPGLLDHLAGLRGEFEVVVVDGGSRDETVAIARNHPLAPRIVESARGRAHQLNAGAGVATGDVLCFLHADTRLPEDAWLQIADTLAVQEIAGGDFRLRFDGHDWFSRLLAAVRAAERRFGVYYGDSAILCRRSVFDELGGYAPMPIMEDYDFVRRLERGFATVCLPGPVVTSARRWKALGLLRTVWSWVVIRALFLAGVEPERLARLYPHAR